MSKEIESRIQCPFYIGEGKTHITCEGLIHGCESVQKFESGKQKSDYEKFVCSVNRGRKCFHYRSVMLLYDKGIRI